MSAQEGRGYVTQADFERHKADPYAHPQLSTRQMLEHEAESVEVRDWRRATDGRLGRLEKFQWWLTGVGSAITLMVGGGILAFLFHLHQ